MFALSVCGTVERSARGHLHAWTLDVACLDHALVMLDTHTHTHEQRAVQRVFYSCAARGRPCTVPGIAGCQGAVPGN